MSMINPTLPNPEVIKIEVDQFHSVTVERERNMKMELEMVNLVRERELLKKEVDELRVKKMESEKAAQLYKSRVDELEPRVLKVEAALAKVLNVNLANLEDAMDKLNMPDFVEKRKVKADADGNGGILLSKKGGRNLAYPGTKPAYISKAAGSKGSLQDNEDKDPEVRGASYRVSLHSQHTNIQAKPLQIRGATYLIPRIINKIKNNLKKENLENFQQSCFGHLIDIGELKNQGQVVLQLLMHMDMAASNKECLVFNINNSRVEFGPREFSLITGLHLGTLKAAATTSSSSSIHEKVFMGKSSIFLEDIEDHFLRVSRVGKSGDEMPLKLALLYFLYGILLSDNPLNKQVDQQYFALIEDLEVFNAFPWGRVAYEFLASSMLLARSRIDDSEVTNSNVIVVFGFSLALQVWAYEIMPSLAAHCAIRASQIPRILLWSTLEKPIYSKDLEKFFTPGEMVEDSNSSKGN